METLTKVHRTGGSQAAGSSGTVGASRARIYLVAAWSSYALLAALLFAPSLSGQQVKTTEYQVKAAYLYNFGLFVTWPAAGKSSPEPFGICVLGKDPFGPILDSTFAGEMLNGRAIAVRRFADARGAHSCGILFISRSEAKKLNTILSALGNAAILTVSDIPGFSQHGGMIEFVRDGDNVRFEVNLTAADAAGLTLSSDLLKVATAVRRNTPSGL
ncbi:MAG: YfiR family protein [Candidatus Acidiferrales bacterium]